MRYASLSHALLCSLPVNVCVYLRLDQFITSVLARIYLYMYAYATISIQSVERWSHTPSVPRTTQVPGQPLVELHRGHDNVVHNTRGIRTMNLIGLYPTNSGTTEELHRTYMYTYSEQIGQVGLYEPTG